MYYVLSVVTLDTSIKHVSVKNNRFKPKKKNNNNPQLHVYVVLMF